MTEPDYDKLLKHLDECKKDFKMRRDGGWLASTFGDAANAIRTLRVLFTAAEEANRLWVEKWNEAESNWANAQTENAILRRQLEELQQHAPGWRVE